MRLGGVVFGWLASTIFAVLHLLGGRVLSVEQKRIELSYIAVDRARKLVSLFNIEG